MNLLKCLSCGGALEQERNVYICKSCGEVFNESEISNLKLEVEPALRITKSPDERFCSLLEEQDMEALLGETLSNLSLDDTLVFDNGEQKKILQIDLKNKRISRAPGKNVLVIVSGKLNSHVAIDTIVYKLAKK